ncbi:phage portal protein family protein [Corynebacterium glutamicum]|uniref:phage portal protein family protein n=1 Tax=Corynebacterium glutamicum TaxID=1718 RepID=UPI003B5A9316
MSDDSVLREVGYARAVRNRALEDDNRALVFPRSAQTFAKMLREDAQVTAIFRAVSLPIRRANWQLDPNGAPADVVAHVAEDLRLRVRGDDPHKPLAPRAGRVSWEKHLEQALYSLIFGHMFFEQVYEVGVDGREHLRKLAPRWPGTLTKINVADDGGLESIEQQASGGKKTRSPKIPVSRLVAYCFDDLGGQWVGRSILRPAYKNWKIKDELLRLELNTLDRNGMGVPVYTGSEFANDPDGDLERGQEIVEGFRSGDHAGASIPAGAKLDVKGTSGQLISPREAIAYHDNMMARSVMAHVLNLDGKGGAYALASTQNDLLVQSLQTMAEWVQDVATQHVVEDLVRVAFPEHDGLMPQLVFDPIASKKEITPGDLAGLLNSKAIFADKDLEEDLRRRYTLPPKQKLSDALKSKQARQELEEQMGVTLSDPQPAEQGELFPVDDVKQPTREPQSKVVNKVTEKDKQEVTVP